MKKLLVIGLAAAFALALVGCGSQEEPAPEEEEVGIANPWTEAASAEEAATIDCWLDVRRHAERA